MAINRPRRKLCTAQESVPGTSYQSPATCSTPSYKHRSLLSQICRLQDRHLLAHISFAGYAQELYQAQANTCFKPGNVPPDNSLVKGGYNAIQNRLATTRLAEVPSCSPAAGANHSATSTVWPNYSNRRHMRRQAHSPRGKANGPAIQKAN